MSSVYVVTGATGYVASWIVHELLTRGCVVRGSVRDLGAKEKIAHLLEMNEQLPGSLELFSADLLAPGSFDAAIDDADIVMHTASPYIFGKVDRAQSRLVDPAVEGTRNVLEAVEKSGKVRRVVLTSSVTAIYGDSIDIVDTAGKFTEDRWNQTSSLGYLPYSYSKTLAERLAWAYAGRQDRWSLVSINPGGVFGPSKTRRVDSTSVQIMKDFLSGKFAGGVPHFELGFVDVRTVAVAHVEAAIRDEVTGRHIVVASAVSFKTIAETLRNHFGRRFRISSRELPKALFYLIGPLLGTSWRFVRRNFGISIAFDNSRSIENLGVQYLPVEQTIIEHAEQLIRDDLL